MLNTWVILLRNIDFAVPSFKVFAHNLTHDEAKAQADEIHDQRVEGERVTRVYIVDGREPHEDADPEECDACHDLILAAHREELAALKREMDKRGLRPDSA
ncbi:MAG TPA: hypothetical protein VFA74_11400 [Terriglobales bacterium]|nr:hypothetical protein [Terriglobales bacterium]